jgi:hypothetical protein
VVGHASLLTTSVFLHVVVDEREEVGELFAALTSCYRFAIVNQSQACKQRAFNK